MDFNNLVQKMRAIEPSDPIADKQALIDQAKGKAPVVKKQVTESVTPAKPMDELAQFAALAGVKLTESVVAEKAVSKKQQKLMGQAYALKKGDMKAKDASKAVKDLAKDMSTSDLKDFASTKHKGLPEKKKKDESLTFDKDAFRAVFESMVAEKKAKPDFLDVDKDGDKKEPMKKAAKEAGKSKGGKKEMSDKQKKYFGKKEKTDESLLSLFDKVETKKHTFVDLVKIVKESGGQQQLDPIDSVLWNWATRVAKTKFVESTKQEYFAGMIYERNGGRFEMYDAIEEALTEGKECNCGPDCACKGNCGPDCNCGPNCGK